MREIKTIVCGVGLGDVGVRLRLTPTYRAEINADNIKTKMSRYRSTMRGGFCLTLKLTGGEAVRVERKVRHF